MIESNTAYLATFYGEQPGLARGTCESKKRHGWTFYVDEWIIGNGILGSRFVHDRNVHSYLFATIPTALAWLIERASACLAEQERVAAQTRVQLEELRRLAGERDGKRALPARKTERRMHASGMTITAANTVRRMLDGDLFHSSASPRITPDTRDELERWGFTLQCEHFDGTMGGGDWYLLHESKARACAVEMGIVEEEVRDDD